MNRTVFSDGIADMWHAARSIASNVQYIREQLPRVETPGALRSQVVQVCTDIDGTLQGVRDELGNLADKLGLGVGLPPHDPEISNTDPFETTGVVRNLLSTVLRIDPVVRALDAAAANDARFIGVYLLVSESAANMLSSYVAMAAALDAIEGELTVLSEGTEPEPASPESVFGCSQCWPDSANAAWEARKHRVGDSALIDESHFHVMILGCSKCAQQFVSVFTETIDWVDGEDPQHWTILPLTPPEAADLVSRSGISETDLGLLGQGRRSLSHDFPKGGSPRNYWGNGMLICPHD